MRWCKPLAWLTLPVGAALLGTTRPTLAASVTEFTGTESFTGIFVDLGRAICPGHSPTGTWPPCPAGSRTHLRGLVRIWEDAFTDPRVCGTNVTTESWNVDATLTGPIWGTFRLVVSPEEVWEGTWTGLWHATTGSAQFVGHGAGGRLEDLQLRYECNYTAGPAGVSGLCSGEILDPTGQ